MEGNVSYQNIHPTTVYPQKLQVINTCVYLFTYPTHLLNVSLALCCDVRLFIFVLGFQLAPSFLSSCKVILANTEHVSKGNIFVEEEALSKDVIVMVWLLVSLSLSVSQ